MTTLDCDEDNFSGTQGRGPRYDIYEDGELVYHDVPESSVDQLARELKSQPWECEITVTQIA